MREASVGFVSSDLFQPRKALASDTGLRKESIDLVICAQAFHWFCNEETVAEFRRIVRPGGLVALVWNERDLRKDRFHRELEELIVRFATDYESVRHDKFGRDRLEKAFGQSIETIQFESAQTFDLEGLTGRIASASYMPNESSIEYQRLVKMLRRLFAEHEQSGKLSVSYKTILFYLEI